jgi:DNA polymerase-3 subunit beta
MINKDSAVKFGISCSLKALLEAMKFANGFVESRPSHPILCGVLLKAESGFLSIESTNLRHGCKIKIPVEVNIPGATIIPCKEFLALLGNLVGDTVDVFLTESPSKPENLIGSSEDYDFLAAVQLGKQQAFLSTFSPNEFPDSQTIKPEHTLDLDAQQLIASVDRTSYTVAKDETKQVLCGINLASKEGCLNFAGTNGHYLAVSAIDGHYDPSLSVTIPGIFFTRLQKLLKDVESVILEISDSAIQANITTVLAKEIIADVSLHTRILDGRFPVCERLIPQEFATKVKVPREQLMQALGLIGVCTTESTNAAETCVVDIQSDQILLSKTGAAIKTISQTIDSEMLDGVPILIGLNHVYFSNILKSLSSDYVIIYLNSPGTPVVIKGYAEPLETTALLMPIQLK